MKLPNEKYGTHKLYPYRGAMHPGLARKCIEMCEPMAKEIILDPYCGSGTTLVEAIMMGLDAVGLDILPICITASNIKTHFAPGDEPVICDPAVRLQMIMSGVDSIGLAYAEICERFAEMRKLVIKHEIALGEAHVAPRSETLAVRFNHIVTSPPYGDLLDYTTAAAAGLYAAGVPREEINLLRGQMLGVKDGYEKEVKNEASLFFDQIPSGGKVVIVVGESKTINCPSVWRVMMDRAGFALLKLTTHQFESSTNEIVEEAVQLYVKP